MKIDIEDLARRLNSEDAHQIASSLGITTLQLAVICRDKKLKWPGASLAGAPQFRVHNHHPGEEVKGPTEPSPIPQPTEEEKRSGRFEMKRRQLYEVVWSYPVVQLARAWGISDVAIGKMCKRHNIPKPGLGYWARLQNGYSCRRTALPRSADDHVIRISCSSQTPPAIEEKPLTRLEYYRKVYPLRDDKQVEAAHDLYENELAAPPIQVQDDLNEPHPLVARAEKRLKSAKRDDRKLVTPGGKGTLSIHVAPDTVPRALRIYDAIIKAAEARGWKVRVDITETKVHDGWRGVARDYPPAFRIQNRTLIRVLGEEVEIALTEKSAQHMRELKPEESRSSSMRMSLGLRPAKEYWFEPTGVLTLSLVTSRLPRASWTDGKRQRVEDVINVLMRTLIDDAVDQAAARLEAEAARIRAEQEPARRAEHERLLYLEKRRLEQLQQDIKEWHAANTIRAYVDAVRTRAIAAGHSVERGTEIGNWIFWATKVADRDDPLTSALPEYSNYAAPQRYW